MIVIVWEVVAGLCLLAVVVMYVWLVFWGPRNRPPWWFIVLALAILPACHAVRFESIAHRPAEYGGGYLVVGECWVRGQYEPCFWMCSPDVGDPERGPTIVCGEVPWSDWGS